MPYRSSPPGQHLDYFLFLQIYFWAAGLFTIAVNGLETYLLVTNVSQDTSFMPYPMLSRFAISFRCPVAKVFLAQKVLQTDLTDDT